MYPLDQRVADNALYALATGAKKDRRKLVAAVFVMS
jgi:hypothetical protein